MMRETIVKRPALPRDLYEAAEQYAYAKWPYKERPKGKQYNKTYLLYREAKDNFIEGALHERDRTTPCVKTDEELDTEFENRKSMGR